VPVRLSSILQVARKSTDTKKNKKEHESSLVIRNTHVKFAFRLLQELGTDVHARLMEHPIFLVSNVNLQAQGVYKLST
jgi:hypothetical protein